jgi:hypothetical protein
MFERNVVSRSTAETRGLCSSGPAHPDPSIIIAGLAARPRDLRGVSSNAALTRLTVVRSTTLTEHKLSYCACDPVKVEEKRPGMVPLPQAALHHQGKGSRHSPRFLHVGSLYVELL